MMRKLTSLVAAIALAAACLAPTTADAQGRHRGGYNYYHGGRHYHGYGYRDHGNAAAAGAVGLILGLAIGSLASAPRQQGCYDRCAPPPPPPCGRCGPGGGYYDQGYRGDPRYDDRGSAYEDDYGVKDAVENYQCTRPERQYDRYARRYVTVDVPC